MPQSDVTVTECAKLVLRGYVALEDHRGLAARERVRHIGEQYPEALLNGTATIIGVFEKPGSSWAQSYHQRDIEVVVATDKGDERVWADYHCVLVHS